MSENPKEVIIPNHTFLNSMTLQQVLDYSEADPNRINHNCHTLSLFLTGITPKETSVDEIFTDGVDVLLTHIQKSFPEAVRIRTIKDYEARSQELSRYKIALLIKNPINMPTRRQLMHSLVPIPDTDECIERKENYSPVRVIDIKSVMKEYDIGGEKDDYEIVFCR